MPQFTASLLTWSNTWSDLAWLLRNVLMAVLLGRILLIGVAARYPILSIYLGLSILRSASLASVTFGTTLYGGVYLLTEPLIWLSYAAASWEIYGLVFEKYRGLSILTRRTLVIVLSVAFAVSLFAASRYMSHAWDVSPFVKRAGLSSRTVVGTFFLFLVALIGFMLWFRMVVARNIITYVVSFSSVFLGVGLGTFLSASSGPEGTRIANFVMLVFIDVVLTGWVLNFRLSGEEVRSRFGPPPDPALERQLLATLDHLNRMAAAAKKFN